MVENQEKIQELQMLEQNLQAIMMQKQGFQMEAAETSSALEEVKASKEDAYKIIGQLMIKMPRDKILKELEEKKEMLDSRLASFEKQEEQFLKRAENLRDEIFNKKEE